MLLLVVLFDFVDVVLFVFDVVFDNVNTFYFFNVFDTRGFDFEFSFCRGILFWHGVVLFLFWCGLILVLAWFWFWRSSFLGGFD